MNIRRRFKLLLKNAQYVGQANRGEYIKNELLRLNIIGNIYDVRNFLNVRNKRDQYIKSRSVNRILKAARKQERYLNLFSVYMFFKTETPLNKIPFVTKNNIFLSFSRSEYNVRLENLFG